MDESNQLAHLTLTSPKAQIFKYSGSEGTGSPASEYLNLTVGLANGSVAWTELPFPLLVSIDANITLLLRGCPLCSTNHFSSHDMQILGFKLYLTVIVPFYPLYYGHPRCVFLHVLGVNTEDPAVPFIILITVR